MSIRGHCLKPRGVREQKSLGNNGLGINARDFQLKGNSITPYQDLFFVLTDIYHYFTVFLKTLLIFVYIISILIFNINIPLTNTTRTAAYFIYILLTIEYTVTQNILPLSDGPILLCLNVEYVDGYKRICLLLSEAYF
jgi:hypothetical protein